MNCTALVSDVTEKIMILRFQDFEFLNDIYCNNLQLKSFSVKGEKNGDVVGSSPASYFI